MSDDSDGKEALIGCGAIVFLLGPTVLAQGWATSLLWLWFIVPLFGLPALSLWQAVGLALVCRFLSGAGQSVYYKGHKLEAVKSAVAALVYPLAATGVGWVYLQALRAWG